MGSLPTWWHIIRKFPCTSEMRFCQFQPSRQACVQNSIPWQNASAVSSSFYHFLGGYWDRSKRSESLWTSWYFWVTESSVLFRVCRRRSLEDRRRWPSLWRTLESFREKVLRFKSFTSLRQYVEWLFGQVYSKCVRGYGFSLVYSCNENIHLLILILIWQAYSLDHLDRQYIEDPQEELVSSSTTLLSVSSVIFLQLICPLCPLFSTEIEIWMYNFSCPGSFWHQPRLLMLNIEKTGPIQYQW